MEATGTDRELLVAFRRAVRTKLARDIANEQEAATRLKERARRALTEALAGARAAGMCAQVWLFGSYAWGEPSERSDIDLLVAGCADPDRLASAVGRKTGTDVHIVQLERAPDSLRQRALAEGVTL